MAGFRDILRLAIHWLAARVYGDIDDKCAYIQRVHSAKAYIMRVHEAKAER